MIGAVLKLIGLPDSKEFKEILELYPQTANVILEERKFFEEKISVQNLTPYEFEKQSKDYVDSRIEFWYKYTIQRSWHKAHLSNN